MYQLWQESRQKRIKGFNKWAWGVPPLTRSRLIAKRRIKDMAEVNSLLIVVNSGADKPYNHYAAYVVAFMGKQVAKIKNVTVYYGPYGVGMTTKGELAKLAIQISVKELVASQIEGLSASDLPDNLEQLARFEKDKLGVNIVSCGTFHVIDGAGKTLDDTSNIEDFITPIKLPQAAEAILGADKIHYL
jgi:predicted peroxiredoxin